MNFRREERPFKQLDSETINFLRERLKTTKDHLRKSCATTIAFSGTLLTLSVAFAEKLAPHKLHLWLLILSWSLLILAIVVAIATLLHMTASSIKHQEELEKLYAEGKISIEYRTYATPGGRWMFFSERIPGEKGSYVSSLLGVGGLLALGCFGIVNVLA